MLDRDIKQESLLRKINRIFKVEDENHEAKSNMNDKEGLDFCKNSYYKLNNL